MDTGRAAVCDYRVIAAIATALLVAALGALQWFDPTRAGKVVVEHGPVEWAQVTLLLAGWMVTVGRAIRLLTRAGAAGPEMLLGTLLTIGISAEVSLHNWVGFHVRHWRPSLRRSARPVFPWVVLSTCLIIGLVIACYGVCHRRTLLGTLRSLPRSRWGQLMIAGGGGYVITQLFERSLSRLMPRPSYFLEETIELISALCLFLAAMQCAQEATGRSTSHT
jgi:hypothetical protein